MNISKKTELNENTNEGVKFHYRCILQYKGTNYHGWQIQRTLENQKESKVEKLNSVQSEVNLALSKLCKNPEVYTIGASRTDAGVHALGQVVRASIPIDLPLKAFTKGLNSLLPNDIKLRSVEKCDESFHPRHQAKWKEYVYLFSIEEESTTNPFVRDLVSQFPFRPDTLDIEKMKNAAKLFQGTHDFKNFFCEGSEFKSTIRDIYFCSLSKITTTSETTSLEDNNFLSHFFPEYFKLRIIGSGFLKQMIRLIIGSIWNIGRNKISFDDINNALSGNRSKNNSKLGIVAPAAGLYLKEIGFSNYEKK